jgi:hypothetical protein
MSGEEEVKWEEKEMEVPLTGKLIEGLEKLKEVLEERKRELEEKLEEKENG